MPGTLIRREHYLKVLHGFKDKPLIKIITGVKKCGKTTLMEMFIEDLKRSGIQDGDILYLDFEKKENAFIRDRDALMKTINGLIEAKEGKYLFFDGIQNVYGWERVINSMIYAGADVYVTGSNSKLLSTKFSTYIAGRYVVIEMYPLSFREYFDHFGGEKGNRDRLLSEYMMNGGLPLVALEKENERNTDMILSSVFETVFIKDVVERNNIENVAAIRDIAEFAMKNIGNFTSYRNAMNYVESKGGNITPPTVENYLHHLESAFLLYRARKYDVREKDYIRAANKFYVVDMGISNNVVGYNEEDRSGALENLVFMELLSRGKEVAVGRVEGGGIDFVVIEMESIHYYQVTDSLYVEEVKKRLIRSLLSTGDNYPKTIITNELYPAKNIEGIRVVNIIDFLLEGYE